MFAMQIFSADLSSIRQSCNRKQIKRKTESKANPVPKHWHRLNVCYGNDKTLSYFLSFDPCNRRPAASVITRYSATSFQFAAIIYSPASLAGLSAYRKTPRWASRRQARTGWLSRNGCWNPLVRVRVTCKYENTTCTSMQSINEGKLEWFIIVDDERETFEKNGPVH